MRRTHLRGHEKILKRLLIHVAASNLSLLMRTLFGIGKPKVLQGLAEKVLAALRGLCRLLEEVIGRCALEPSPSLARIPIRLTIAS